MKRLVRLRGHDGFTLIETAIAMFFISFIVGGMAMIFMHSSRSSVYSRRLATANILAEQEIEKARNKDYTNLRDLDTHELGAAECFDVHMAQVNCAHRDAHFTRYVNVTTTEYPDPAHGTAGNPDYHVKDAGLLANLTHMEVVVVWGDRLGNTHEATVESYISRY